MNIRIDENYSLKSDPRNVILVESKTVKLMAVNLESVKGYSTLSQEQKDLFKNTYSEHYKCMSGWMQEKWIPQIVEAADYGVKVIMPGKDWFHYNWKGEWY